MARPNRSCACDDFRRSTEATRNQFVGRSQLTRRQLIGWGAAAGLSLYSARAMPVTEVFDAARADAASAPNASVLVAIFLPGGLDLLDTLVPANYGRYADLHPHVRIGDPVALNGTAVRMHRGLAEGIGEGIRGMYGRNRVAFLPGIDYPDPNLSHFHSRHFWETGVISARDGPGWLGRWLDVNGNANNPLQGLSLSYDLSPVLRSRTAPVASVDSPGSSGFYIRDVYGEPFTRAMETYATLARTKGGGPGLRAAKRSARLTKHVSDLLAPYEERDGVDPLASKIAYPSDNGFADRLRSLAGLIAAPLGIRVATVDAPGDFDTHSNQRTTLATDLPPISAALSAFQADLEARGVADRVLTLVWSEFGRRPHDNDSGTDHGAAGLAWIQGTRVNSGFQSQYPDLFNFDADDNLKVTLDFRTVYASLIEQWLGTDAGAVIPNAAALGRIKLVR